jgi:glycosyltransferase involved in cell wall biosynthesis
MRVLMTADAVGGVWTYALDLTTALTAREVEVTLAVMGPPPSPRQLEAAAAAGVAAVHAEPYALEWMHEPWDDVDAATAWLLALEREVQADVVHLNGYCHAVAPWVAPVVVVAHSDVVSWWMGVYGERPGDEWAEYERRVRTGLSEAAAVVAPTDAALRSVESAFGAVGTVIHNGRSHDWVREVSKEPFVLGIGRLWDPAKNADALAQAAAGLDWPVLLAGDVAPPNGEPRPIRETVQHLGAIPFDVLATWLARASVFASPARYEPFGLGALEGALCGCALVLGDIPSLREVWGDAAVFVDPDDVDELHGALVGLIADPVVRTELAARARRRAERYNVESMGVAYRDLYASLVDGDRVPSSGRQGTAAQDRSVVAR